MTKKEMSVTDNIQTSPEAVKPKSTQLNLCGSVDEKLRILVVEDSLINQMLTERSIHKLGYEVEMANDGEEAIALLRESDFDLILMDIQMPGMDGVETTKYIRNELKNPTSEITIIAMTSSVIDSEVSRYYEAGVNGCLEKPFNQFQLFGKIQQSIIQRS